MKINGRKQFPGVMAVVIIKLACYSAKIWLSDYPMKSEMSLQYQTNASSNTRTCTNHPTHTRL